MTPLSLMISFFILVLFSVLILSPTLLHSSSPPIHPPSSSSPRLPSLSPHFPLPHSLLSSLSSSIGVSEIQGRRDYMEDTHTIHISPYTFVSSLGIRHEKDWRIIPIDDGNQNANEKSQQIGNDVNINDNDNIMSDSLTSETNSNSVFHSTQIIHSDEIFSISDPSTPSSPLPSSSMSSSESSSPLSSASSLYFFGVFDGHSGPHTSTFISSHLIPSLSTHISSLTNISSSTLSPLISSEFHYWDSIIQYQENLRIQNKLKLYEKEYSEWLSEVTHNDNHKANTQQKHQYQRHLAIWKQIKESIHNDGDGSTALVVMLDKECDTIVVSNVGDCRAIMIGDEGRGKEQKQNNKNHQNSEKFEDSLDSEKHTQHGSEKVSMENDHAEGDDDDDDDDIPFDLLSLLNPNFDPTSDGENPFKSDDDITAELSSMITLSSSPLSPSSLSSVYFPLTIDHKPHLPSETSYIHSMGGFVTHRYVSRVNGMLAVSRAFGDFGLKPMVRVEPEITYYTIQRRGLGRSKRGGGKGEGEETDNEQMIKLEYNPNDEVSLLSTNNIVVNSEEKIIVDADALNTQKQLSLVSSSVSSSSPPLSLRHDRWILIASDGFWDVVGNAEVSLLINRLIGENGKSPQWTAKKLMDMAYKRGSMDNITVMIIDMETLKSKEEKEKY